MATMRISSGRRAVAREQAEASAHLGGPAVCLTVAAGSGERGGRLSRSEEDGKRELDSRLRSAVNGEQGVGDDWLHCALRCSVGELGR